MKTMIRKLEKLIETWEAYENPLEPAQCDEVLQTISELQAALRSYQPTTSFLALVIENRFSGRDISPDTQLMIEIPHALAQADEARLLLAVYRPHCQSQTRHHLQERREVAAQLQHLIRAVSTANMIQVNHSPSGSETKTR